jgi:hypothetical protein
MHSPKKSNACNISDTITLSPNNLSRNKIKSTDKRLDNVYLYVIYQIHNIEDTTATPLKRIFNAEVCGHKATGIPGQDGL